MREKIIPSEFIQRWELFYGKARAKSIETNLKQRDPRIIVPNSLKTDRQDLKRRLEKKGFKFRQTNEYNTLIVSYEPFNIVSTPEYLTGFFSIQAITSLLPPRILQPSSKNLVADLTASPGIKTCLLAQQMGNKGTIIAIEKSKSRIPALKANLARMGIWNTIVLHFDSNLFSTFGIQVDHVLLDAPCSGTGLKLTKDKRLRNRLLKDIFRNVKKQKNLLETAWGQLKTNGTLVYSTCSLEPEEGEVQISEFLQRHSNEAKLIPISSEIGVSGKNTKWNVPLHSKLGSTRRIFPKPGFDGFFIAYLKKEVA